MNDTGTRIRLNDTDRKLLAEVIDEAVANEVDMVRKVLLLQILKRMITPTVGHPESVDPTDMDNLSEAYYAKADSEPEPSVAARKKAGRCEECGLVDPQVMELHHRDMDRLNNDPSNLQILCANCHRKVTRKQMQLLARLGLSTNHFTLYPGSKEHHAVG